MSKKQLSDGNPDGTVLGQSATDKISFFGGTPIAKQGGTAMVVPTVAYTVQGSSPFGFSTSADFIAFVAQVRAMADALVKYGLMKNS
jgi:hypothetical protein